MGESKANQHPQQREFEETGAGGEAAEGMHSAGGRPEEDTSGVEQTRDQADDRSGSEPLRDRTENPKGGYGGEGGVPRGDHSLPGARRAAEGAPPDEIEDAATRA